MKFTKEHGITLLALIITIIVLVILAGVALNTLFGNNGILDNSKYSAEQYTKSVEKEAIQLAFADLKMKLYTDDNITEITAELLEQRLNDAGNNVEVTDGENGNFVITFKNTGNVYEVASNGSIVGEDKTDVVQEPEEVVDLQELYTTIGLIDYWKLQGSLDNEVEGRDSLVTNTGTPAINDTEVYLNGAMLSTSENYYLNGSFTMIIQAKDIVFNSGNFDTQNYFIGIGSARSNIGSYLLGMGYRTGSSAYLSITGAGDSYGIGINTSLDWENWHTFASTWDGSKYIFYIDGEKIGESIASKCPNNSKLYVGGAGGSNVKTTGNYKNVLIFNRALADYEIDNWETIISSTKGVEGTGNIPLYTSQQVKTIGTGEVVYYKNIKKAYKHELGKKYVMQNDITFYGDFTQIQQLIDTNQITIDENGYTLTLVNSTNPEYFNYTVSGTNATITGFSEEGRTLYNEGELTEIIFPSVNPDKLEITTLGGNAFSGCSKLEAITISNSVTTIETRAFYGCSGLKTLILSNSLRDIGDAAFYACGLTALTIPEGVESIGVATFGECNILASVTIPLSLVTCRLSGGQYCRDTLGVGWRDCGPFITCSSLKTINFPSEMTEVPANIFYGCTGIENVVIPNKVTRIKNNAFCGCNILSDVTIPNSVNYIEMRAFYGCSGLKDIQIPSSIIDIGDAAFYACGLTALTIPEGVESIGVASFGECNSLASVIIPSTLVTCRLSGGQYCRDTLGVGWRNCGPFIICSSLKTITFSSDIQNIPANIFYGCTGIENVVIPNKVTRIKSNAFCGCNILSDVTIPNSVNYIEMRAFYGCSGLQGIQIPSSIIDIGDAAFYACGLTALTIPEGVESIGVASFGECNSLASVIIPSTLVTCRLSGGQYCRDTLGVEWRNCGPFITCSSLKTIQFTSGIPNIPAFIFYGCTGIETVTIPSGVQNIGARSFYACTSLASITIPGTVKDIGDAAFYRCALTSLVLPEGVESIGVATFGNCNSLASVTLPSTLVTCRLSGGQYCRDTLLIAWQDCGPFLTCSSLKTINWTGTTTTIPSNTFHGCIGIESITIPGTVTTIGGNAFNGCSNLATATFGGTRSQWNSVTIGSNNTPLTSATVHCSDD